MVTIMACSKEYVACRALHCHSPPKNANVHDCKNFHQAQRVLLEPSRRSYVVISLGEGPRVLLFHLPCLLVKIFIGGYQQLQLLQPQHHSPLFKASSTVSKKNRRKNFLWMQFSLGMIMACKVSIIVTFVVEWRRSTRRSFASAKMRHTITKRIFSISNRMTGY